MKEGSYQELTIEIKAYIAEDNILQALKQLAHKLNREDVLEVLHCFDYYPPHKNLPYSLPLVLNEIKYDLLIQLAHDNFESFKELYSFLAMTKESV